MYICNVYKYLLYSLFIQFIRKYHNSINFNHMQIVYRMQNIDNISYRENILIYLALYTI